MEFLVSWPLVENKSAICPTASVQGQWPAIPAAGFWNLCLIWAWKERAWYEVWVHPICEALLLPSHEMPGSPCVICGTLSWHSVLGLSLLKQAVDWKQQLPTAASHNQSFPLDMLSPCPIALSPPFVALSPFSVPVCATLWKEKKHHL